MNVEFYSKKIEHVYEPDVLVCGLGPAGIRLPWRQRGLAR